MSDLSNLPVFEILIRLALLFYTLALFFYFSSKHYVKYQKLYSFGRLTSFIAFGLQTIGLIYRSIEYWGQYKSLVIPATGFYEALNFFAWSIGLVFVIGSLFVSMQRTGWLVMMFPTIFLLILQLTAHPSAMTALAPSLRNSVWLNLHILTIFLSYGCLVIGAVFAIIHLVYTRKTKHEKSPELLKLIQELDYTSYLYTAIAFPFLTAGIWLGAVWADQAWGRPWGWDPKEVWSLITWLVYAVYLHSRLIAKWDSRKSNWFAVLGLIALLITYFGVNFIVKFFQLSSLHTYN